MSSSSADYWRISWKDKEIGRIFKDKADALPSVTLQTGFESPPLADELFYE